MSLQHSQCSSRTFSRRQIYIRCNRHAAIVAQADSAAMAGRNPAAARKDVAVKLTATSFSSRKLQATVNIQAPLPVVWEALTDYDRLGTFIPSLVENRCLERRKQGCLLYQVGAQDVAMGIKFSAACTLEIKEYPDGIPISLCSSRGDFSRHFPCPTSTSTSTSTSSVSSISSYSSMDSMASMDEAASSSGARDISFNLVAGDFQAFKGIWRMQPTEPDPSATTLQYALFVRPHPWLPVKLIEDRISAEVVNNLNAVRRHTEKVHKHRLQQQQVQQQQQQQGVNAVNGSGSSGPERSSSSTLSSSSARTFVDQDAFSSTD